jgi:hypothetical protein
VDTDRLDSRTFSTSPRRLACVFPSHSGTCFHPNQSSLGRPDESTTSIHHCHCRVQTQCAFIQPRASVSRTRLHPRLCMRNSQTPPGHAILLTQPFTRRLFPLPISTSAVHLHLAVLRRIPSTHGSPTCADATFVEPRCRQRDDKHLYRNVVAGVCMMKIWKTTHQ